MKVRSSFVIAFAVTALVAGACSSAATTAPTAAPATPAPASVAPASVAPASVAPASVAPASVAPAASMAPLNVSSFDTTYSAMAGLTSMVSAGSGMVGVILPDVTTSPRYTSYDLPMLTKAFTAAGYSATQFKIENASGSTNSEVAIAQADITAGAKVLLVDPLDAPTGLQVEALAAAAGIPYISYDRATFQGTTTYYVSFDNQQVGKLMGQGVEQCVTAWGVKNPKVFELNGGEDTDPNAIDFAKGYNSVLWGQAVGLPKVGITNSLGYTLVGTQIAPGWDATKGATVFQQAYTANKAINTTVEANDTLANAVITDLKGAGVGPKTVPTTGQDASLGGMEYILENWQCGSVYKPIYKEAQAAVALATYLRAGQTPPASLLNGSTTDPANKAITEPAVLLTPTWVNAANMASTVIADNFVSASALCAAVGASVCSANGITP